MIMFYVFMLKKIRISSPRLSVGSKRLATADLKKCKIIHLKNEEFESES